jgi:hypothetical protein
MKRSTGPLLVLLACAVGLCMPATASATAPTILFLAGEGTPLELSSEGLPNEIQSELQTGTEALTADGLSLVLNTTGGSPNSGEYSLALKNVTDKSNHCNTSGDKEGEVLMSGNEYSLAYDALGTALGVAELLSFKELSITCGTSKVKLKGSLLTPLEPINKEVSSNALGEVFCPATKGTPAQTKYWNSSGEEKTAKFELNFGVGYEQASMAVTGAIALTFSKMIEVMG